MCQSEISFYCGEVKYISATVVPQNTNEVVVISSAEFELSDSSGAVVESGACEISGTQIKMLLSVTNVETICYYTLKITVKIGKETVIQKTRIKVRE